MLAAFAPRPEPSLMEAVVPFLPDAAVVLPLFAWAAWRKEPFRFVAAFALWTLIVTAGTLCLTPGGTLLGLIGIPLIAALRSGGAPRRVVGPGAVAVAVLVIGFDGSRFYRYEYAPWREDVRAAQERYPPVPRSERLPDREPVLTQDEPHPATEEWTEHFSSSNLIRYPRGNHDAQQRGWTLSLLHGLHEEFSLRFAGRVGFGTVRMGRNGRNPQKLLHEEVRVPAFPQPREGEMWPDEWLTHEVPADPDAVADLAAWHTERGIDFANGAGFGVLAGVDGDGWSGAVLPDDADPADAPFLIGFRPHAAGAPAGDGPLMPDWTLDRVELIGLLLHDEPVAYASADLPRMGETATHETRPLTDFEAAALPKLAAGEWVVAAADDYRLRAVGALPAAKACAACHGVEEGRLLGALSYDFTRPTPTSSAEAAP